MTTESFPSGHLSHKGITVVFKSFLDIQVELHYVFACDNLRAESNILQIRLCITEIPRRS